MSPGDMAQMMTVLVGMAAGLGIGLTFLQILSEERKSRRQRRKREQEADCGSISGTVRLQGAQAR